MPPRKRLDATLRLLHRLVIAIIAIVVCGGVAGAVRGSANLLGAAIDAVTPPPAQTERAGRTPDPAHDCRDRAACRRLDLKAVESDFDDDDDDAPCDAADGAPLAFRCVPSPRGAARVGRGELSIDTSRFARGPGLPRGPPA